MMTAHQEDEMSYEPGVLVRRQQREYPQELRQEIALAALEVGNNREVARLYSERLGYTVNESTVRGIKKRYLEGVHKGKISSPGVSPRASGGEESRDAGEEEGEGLHPGDLMNLQLEVLEGKMKNSVHMEEDEEDRVDEEEDEEETMAVTRVTGEDSLVMHASALVNGDDLDDLEEEEGQLSIDTGEEEEVVRPTIRVARGLVKDTATTPVTNGKRKAVSSASCLPVKKVRPSAVEAEVEGRRLEEEVRALQWLARRKEQEWEQVVRLLKQKEERLLVCQRNRAMVLAEAEHLVARVAPVVVPQQQVLVLAPAPRVRALAPKPPSTAPSPVKTPRPSPTKPAAVEEKVEVQESKFSSVMEKASRNLAKATKGKAEEGPKEKKEKVTPVCQGCSKRKSEFVCAGCSNRWYCSRECQVDDWDDHADDCSG